MSKKKTGFDHDSNALQDDKIRALLYDYGMEGYGRFWATVEMLASKESSGYMLELNSKNYKALASIYNVEEEEAKRFIRKCIEDYELFKKVDGNLVTDSLVARMGIKKKNSKKREDAAKKAANARWENKKMSVEIIQLENLYLDTIIYFPDTFKPKEDKTKKKRIDQIDKLIRIDGLDPEEIKAIVKYGREDEFWSKNFLSLMKLRNTNKEGIPYWKVFSAQMNSGRPRKGKYIEPGKGSNKW